MNPVATAVSAIVARRGRLATTLVVSHVLVIAVATAITSIGLLSLAGRYFIDADRQSLAMQARLLAQSCDDTCIATRTLSAAVLGTGLPPASQVVQTNARNAASQEQITQQNGAIVAPLTSDARVVARADGAGSSAVVAHALEGRRSTERRGSTMLAAAPVLNGGVVVGAVEVRASLSDAQRVVADLRRRSLAAALIAVVVAALVAVQRARTITRPLAALRDAAAAVAQGHYDHPLPDARGGGEVAALTASFASMRDQVRNELATRAAFVADASHELRTPLTALRGYLELLQGGAADKPEIRTRFLESMAVQTQRLITLTDDLLLLSQGDASALRLQLEPTSWFELVEQTVEPFVVTGESRGVEIVLRRSDGGCTVVIDRGRLQQVIVNLVDNALRHARRRVTVTAGCRTGVVVLEVSDDGPGIPIAEREAIFERFTRLDTARARDGSGNAGLGLAIVAALVGAHGGTVTAAEGSGGGALLRVVIPQVPRAAPPGGPRSLGALG